MNDILVFGGGGYCGSVLIPELLDEGHCVTVFDTFWYGQDHLPTDNSNLKRVTADVRDLDAVRSACAGQDTVIHLACISNDSSFELDEKLSTTINLEAFEPVVIEAKKAGVKRFVFASSSSVYGVSDAPDVTEDHPLVPLTLYNKYKGMCEPLLLKHTDENFVGVVFRPATVCGYAPRQRLDVSVNILTNHALNRGKITVFGGSQLRPNLHVRDYTAVCRLLASAHDEKIANEVFNVGTQNMSIMDIARTVQNVVAEIYPERDAIPIVVEPTDDIRSYHINSDKIRNVLGFKPQYSVEDAVRGLVEAFDKGLLPDSFDDDRYYNVRTMKAIGAV
jgi:nucleoside-diphosphate-sugar epimerase